MKPSVLMLGKYYPPVRGGMEEYVHGLAEAVADGCDLTVMVHAEDRFTSTEQTGRYRVVRSGTWIRIASQPISPGMVVQLVRRRYDIIHFHAPNVFGVVAVLVFGRARRIIVTHHADMVGFGLAGRLAARLYRRLLRRTSAVTVLSLKNRDLARDVRGVDVPFVGLPVGLEPERFVPDQATTARARQIRNEHGASRTLFAFVGRLVGYKGIDVLIDALPLVDNVRCLIIGDGREREALAAQARARGVEDKITFIGQVDDNERLAVLHAADVFVLPSVSTAEAFGIAQVEAQLIGLPVITTDLPTGVTEVTRHEETGLVVAPRSPDQLAAAMARLAGDPALRRRLGDGGRARAQANYTIAAVRRTARDLYRQVLDSEAIESVYAAGTSGHATVPPALHQDSKS